VDAKQSMSKNFETNETPLRAGPIIVQKFADKYKAILVLSFLIILFWVCFSLGESEWPHRISYAFHESFYIPVNIGLFLIPIVGVIMILGYLTKAVRKEKTKQCIIHLLIISMIFITHLFLLRYAFSFVTTSGYAVISDKKIDDDTCYIYVDNGENAIRLNCTSDIYEQLVADNKLAYKIEYKWSELTPEKGKLIEITPNDVIDNR
jgi:hypothetical protein